MTLSLFMFKKQNQSRNGTTNLDGDIALGDLPHIEANCGNHVFAELARLKGTNKQDAFVTSSSSWFLLNPNVFIVFLLNQYNLHSFLPAPVSPV